MKWLIYHINDFSESQYKQAYNSLSYSRKLRIDKYKREDDRRRSLAGELLVKQLLAKEFNISDASIECDEKGKPFVRGEDIYISISHSGDKILCAADFKPLGADIEKIKPINLKIAQKIATDKELKFINGSVEKFYEVWTAKEAYFKLKGGNAANFKTFDILDLKRKIILKEEYFAQIVSE